MGGGAGGEFLPLVAMVVVQVVYAGMNIIAKLAMDDGMDPLILVAYRQLLAAFALSPLAYFLERKTRPKITKKILFQIYLCSIFGASLNQIFYYIGLKNSTATISCALGNVLPAITFVLAVLFGLESVGIKSRPGQAKVLGTILCVGGAMLLSFYHGHTISIGKSGIKWKFTHTTSSQNSKGSFFSGSFLLLISNILRALWFILQAKMGKEFSAPYTSTALMCFMASIQCFLIAAWSQHKASKWSLASRIKLVATLYAGIISSALAFCLMSWTILKKGPLYASVFTPLLLIIVALLSWALLNEQLYIGTAIGSFLIVVGLYVVLWGKNKESKVTNCAEEEPKATSDQEQPKLQGVELI
ncbi:hypothetical protein Dimus_021642 [Dionaea muscipula]